MSTKRQACYYLSWSHVIFTALRRESRYVRDVELCCVRWCAFRKFLVTFPAIDSQWKLFRNLFCHWFSVLLYLKRQDILACCCIARSVSISFSRSLLYVCDNLISRCYCFCSSDSTVLLARLSSWFWSYPSHRIMSFLYNGSPRHLCKSCFSGCTNS